MPTIVTMQMEDICILNIMQSDLHLEGTLKSVSFFVSKFKTKEKIMRAKRFTAILLLIVTVIGLFPAVSFFFSKKQKAA